MDRFRYGLLTDLFSDPEVHIDRKLDPSPTLLRD